MSRSVMRDAVREKHRKAHDMCQDAKERGVSMKEFHVVSVV